MSPFGFRPAPDLEEWARETFIAETARLHNPDHFHLNQAVIGFLWTNEENSRASRTVLGQCEIMPPMAMGKWQRARALAQMEDWFGDCPHFVITIHAGAASSMDDASFMALVEHELYHAAQARDQFGFPKFSKQTGLPVWAIRGHDVEEFVGVVARYGAAAAGVEEMVRVANKGPEIAPAAIARACGTCLRAVG
jgi:hypothetical protein